VSTPGNIVTGPVEEAGGAKESTVPVDTTVVVAGLMVKGVLLLQTDAGAPTGMIVRGSIGVNPTPAVTDGTTLTVPVAGTTRAKGPGRKMMGVVAGGGGGEGGEQLCKRNIPPRRKASTGT